MGFYSCCWLSIADVQSDQWPHTTLIARVYVLTSFLSPQNPTNIKVVPKVLIGLLQQTVTWYKIRHTGGQAHYYSRTGTLRQRQVKLDWLGSLCFNVPVQE